MATQYTSILKLALPTQGELDGTWGGVVNDNITSMVEEAIAGLSTINTWTTDSHTLTTANGVTSESRAAMLVLTDTGTALTGAGEVICPTATKIYIVKNDTGQTITVKTSAGTGVDIPTGTIRIVFCDGTNVVQASASLSGLGVTATATELNVLDGITATTAELNILDGVTADATEINVLDGITATTTELNILDGVTSTAAELNILDGATLTTTELNYVDGVTSAIQTQLDAKVGSLTDLGVTATSAELNILDGATLTTTELNYVDGVTSAIQTQINAVNNLLDGTTPVNGIDINSGSIVGTGTEIVFKSFAGAPTSGDLATAELGLDLTNNKLYSSTDGTDVVEIGSFNGQFADGSLASPSITFSSDTDTGFYRAGSGTVSYSYNAARRFTLGDSIYVTNTSNATGIPSSSERFVQMPNNGLFGIKLQNQLTGVFTDSSTTTTYNAGAFYLAGASKGSIVVSTGGTAYNTSSDYRLKENVVPIENAVARIDSLNPVRFNFTADPTKTVDGFLAHEVTPVVPEAITGEKDAVDADGNPVYQGIDQAKLVPLLVAAVQELSARVAALEAN
jgi:hypothetical protein